ncbi:hypothetical protein CR983_00675 [Candidatus Saccharibacteria bacterium]|nr:MAG: hypothetical protein CR983_00675 [Candidatus Saccharibacteria bacterium]
MSRQHTQGFSLIELVVTIAVASLFALSILQLSTVNLRVSVLRTEQEAARTFAHEKNLAYTSSELPLSTWFHCSFASGSSNTNDMTVNPSASGTVLESGNLPSGIEIEGGGTYEVRALAPYGCSGPNTGSPLRLETTVTYAGESVSDITYGAWR